MNPLDLTTLKLFCDIVETGSFSRTAERNYISQPAASQRLQALEKEYRQQFLFRGHGKDPITPTEAGKLLYRRACSLLDDANDLDTALRKHAETIAGTVRVCSVYSLGLHLLPRHLRKFIEQYPEAHVEVQYSHADGVYKSIQGGDADVGVVAMAKPMAGLLSVPFANEEMVVLCARSSPLSSLRELSLKQLSEVPLVAFAAGSPTRTLIEDAFGRAGAKPTITAEYENIELIKSVVQVTGAVAIVPEESARHDLSGEDLQCIRFVESERFTRSSALILRDDRTVSAIVRAFVRSVRA